MSVLRSAFCSTAGKRIPTLLLEIPEKKFCFFVFVLFYFEIFAFSNVKKTVGEDFARLTDPCPDK